MITFEERIKEAKIKTHNMLAQLDELKLGKFDFKLP